MVLVISIKDGFYKIEKSIFRPNYARYEKMLRSKIIHLKEVYKFRCDHFLEKRTVFILIKKTLYTPELFLTYNISTYINDFIIILKICLVNK